MKVLQNRDCICETGDKLEEACRDLIEERDEWRAKAQVAEIELAELRKKPLCKGVACQHRAERDALADIVGEQVIDDA